LRGKIETLAGEIEDDEEPDEDQAKTERVKRLTVKATQMFKEVDTVLGDLKGLKFQGQVMQK
jgi:hypothetical protein